MHVAYAIFIYMCFLYVKHCMSRFKIIVASEKSVSLAIFIILFYKEVILLVSRNIKTNS